MKKKGRFVERSRSRGSSSRRGHPAKAARPVEQPREVARAPSEMELHYRWVPCWWRFDGGYYEIFAAQPVGSYKLCPVPPRLSKAEADEAADRGINWNTWAAKLRAPEARGEATPTAERSGDHNQGDAK